MRFKIRKGLDLPIAGGLNSQKVAGVKAATQVAIVGPDYTGMKPTMLVKEGDTVKVGQPIFECKKNVGVIYTSPAAGKVKEIRRGERRFFQAMIIEVAAQEDHIEFKNYSAQSSVDSLSEEQVRALLIESGEWTALRQRPYEKVATVGLKPRSIFITAMDTNPLALDPAEVINARKEDFEAGVKALSKLTEGKIYYCVKDQSSAYVPSIERLQKMEFAGVHPAGNAGTHIHFVDPVGPTKFVWHINYQDVIAYGVLFRTGKLELEKTVSLAGPMVREPKVIKVRRGALLDEVVHGELIDGPPRVISGSVFNGRKSTSEICYLGRYHNQISVIEESAEREFLGWQSPGLNKFSVKNIYLSKLMPFKKFAFTANRNGSFRAIVPIGSYEKVMPLDILPTQLVRSLLCKDTDMAQDLGCLELAEEDMALLTFVDIGKTDFGPVLRENLNVIEKDG